MKRIFLALSILVTMTACNENEPKSFETIEGIRIITVKKDSLISDKVLIEHKDGSIAEYKIRPGNADDIDKNNTYTLIVDGVKIETIETYEGES